MMLWASTVRAISPSRPGLVINLTRVRCFGVYWRPRGQRDLKDLQELKDRQDRQDRQDPLALQGQWVQPVRRAYKGPSVQRDRRGPQGHRDLKVRQEPQVRRGHKEFRAPLVPRVLPALLVHKVYKGLLVQRGRLVQQG